MTSVKCSDVEAEPLAGSAKEETAYVLFESPGGWSRDVLDGDTFGEELTAKLKAKFAESGVGFQLIRRNGRRGRDVGKLRRCYLVWAKQQLMELVLLRGPEDVLDLDLSGPGKNSGEKIDGPLVLVCTHSKRDKCCAVKGRPLAARLTQKFPDSMVWESSHMKGHRFAPTVQLMPWAYSFGRLNDEAADQMVESARRGELFYPANRGRGIWSPQGQVAELAVARELITTGEAVPYGALQVEEPAAGDSEAETTEVEAENAESATAATVRVSHRDGRAWDVELLSRVVDGIVASCGKPPKSDTVWEAVRVSVA